MSVLTPQPKMQFVNAAGVPLAGGKLYTYAAGTTTPLVTYTDSTGATPNTNPVILNSRGEANVWLGSAAYKFKLTDSTDVEIWTVDYISAPTSGVSPVLSGNVVISSDTPGTALTITQTGTGAVLRVQDSTDPDATPFIVDTNGYVGVGTPSPTVPLEVTGAAKIASLSLTSTPLSLANGGTGGTSASTARTNLGVAIGTDVLAYVAPGTSGNALVSDGTNWTSAPRSVPTIAAGDSGKTLINNGSVSSWGSSIVSATAVASTSGTSIDFTGIPSWAKRVTVMFQGVSLSGTDNILVRIGSGSLTTSGYVSTSINVNNANGTGGASATNGFIIGLGNATFITSGHMILTNITGNVWVMSFTLKDLTTQAVLGAGEVTISGAIDRLSVLSSTTNTFDAGTLNISWQ